MNEDEVTALVQRWEADGFKFIGNGFENNDDDPMCCPKCGFSYIFWALWEHPTRIRNADKDTEYKPHLLNALNRCYDCGHDWTDEDHEDNYYDYNTR